MCCKCILHCSGSHREDLVDLDALAPMYVAAQLRECDRVQQAFHASLKQFTDAEIAAVSADIRRCADLAQQRGDELIANERARVSNSLNQVQVQVAQGLPQLEDKGAFVTEMMGERCLPWFSLDVARAVTDRVDVFRTDVEAPASPLLSMLQPQQLQRPGMPLRVTAGLWEGHGSVLNVFHFKMSSSDTLAHLKIQLEKTSGIARNRMLVKAPYGCDHRPNDEDELETFVRYHGEVKAHVYVDHPDQVITI